MKKMRQKLTILIILSLFALAGCNQSGTDKSKELELKEKELALKEKELELKQKAPTEGNSNKAETTESNSNKAATTEVNSNKAEKLDGNSNKAETTKKVEKTNSAIVTAEQVNGTWGKGESWIKIKALGGGKLNVNFSIFNERTTNAGQADGVANINGIDATFSPKDFENCRFTMKFTGGKLIVKQFGTDLDCGFGMGVSADGTYTKKQFGETKVLITVVTHFDEFFLSPTTTENIAQGVVQQSGTNPYVQHKIRPLAESEQIAKNNPLTAKSPEPAKTESNTKTEESAKHEKHWDYEENGHDKWARLNPENKLCGEGKRQSPIDITNAKTSELTDISIKFPSAEFTMTHNEHVKNIST